MHDIGTAVQVGYIVSVFKVFVRQCDYLWKNMHCSTLKMEYKIPGPKSFPSKIYSEINDG